MSKSLTEYLSITPSQITNLFDREIPEDHLGRFYRWMEDRKSGAFSRAYGKFMSDTIYAQSQKDFLKCNVVFVEFMKSLLDVTSEYRLEMGLDESKIFIDSLVKRGKT